MMKRVTIASQQEVLVSRGSWKGIDAGDKGNKSLTESASLDSAVIQLHEIWSSLAENSGSLSDSGCNIERPTRILPCLGEGNVRVNSKLTNLQFNLSYPYESGYLSKDDSVNPSKIKESTFIPSDTLSDLSKKFDLNILGIRFPSEGKDAAEVHSSPSSSEKQSDHALPVLQKGPYRISGLEQRKKSFSLRRTNQSPERTFSRSFTCQALDSFPVSQSLHTSPSQTIKETPSIRISTAQVQNQAVNEKSKALVSWSSAASPRSFSFRTQQSSWL